MSAALSDSRVAEHTSPSSMLSLKLRWGFELGCPGERSRVPCGYLLGVWAVRDLLPLDDELFSPDAYYLADRGLERVCGHRVVPEVG